MKDIKRDVEKEEVLEAVEQNKEVVSKEMISEWKKQWGKIFKTVVGEETFIWRKLKRKEYVEIMSLIQETPEGEVVAGRIYYRQEKITEAVVLFPENILEKIESDAGLATCIADEVIIKSGFDMKPTEEL